MLAISYRLLLTVLAWPSLQHACGDQVANSGATVSDTGFSREYQLNELKAKQAALKSHSQGEGANHTVPGDTPVTPFTLRKLEEDEIIFNGYHCRAAHADKVTIPSFEQLASFATLNIPPALRPRTTHLSLQTGRFVQSQQRELRATHACRVPGALDDQCFQPKIYRA